MSIINNSLVVIGRRDRIDFPDLGINNIEAKVDTGAYGSALHSHHVEVIMINDIEYLTFKLLDPSHPEYADKIFKVRNFKDKVVKSSSGESEHRYTFKTNVSIFGKTERIEFSLTNREKMKYPVLIGRKFLKKRFIVDVQLKDLSYHQKQLKP